MTGLNFGNHFYHKTIRKIVIGFGTMFNDIQMVKYSSNNTELERVLVPIMYGQKEKFLSRILQNPTLTRSIQASLPRMSFELLGFRYDANRKQQSTLRTTALNSSTNSQLQVQYMQVPYDLDFELSIWVRNIEDGTQILEQILPMFTPDYTLTINFSEFLNRDMDIPIVLKNVEYQYQNMGTDFTPRILEIKISFVVKALLFQPSANSKIILKANTYFYDSSLESQITKKGKAIILNLQNNGSGVYKEGEMVTQGGINQMTANTFGEVLYFDTLNNKLYLTKPRDYQSHPAEFVSNVIIRGVQSGATWNVANLYISNIPLVIGYARANNSNANIDGPFGYTTSIIEFPDTI